MIEDIGNDLPTDDAPDDAPSRSVSGSLPRRRERKRHWAPEAPLEAAAALRLLMRQPWLVAGRDDDQIALVRRNLTAIREALTRLGWVLIVERDLVRLRKSPPPRRQAWASIGPSPLDCSWFFLLVAAAEAAPPRLGIAQLVNGARAAAAEAGVAVTNEIAERRSIVRALKLLDERGVVERLEGNVDGFVNDENAPVLLAVHHTRLAHVIANYGSADPVQEPLAWLEQVEREPDAARRMRRRLVDDAVTYAIDLDDAEADWLSRRLRADDGGPLATAFGLHVERRSEGVAFVVPSDGYKQLSDLGDNAFPSAKTEGHAALLLCERAGVDGRPSDGDGPGPGWRGLDGGAVLECLAGLAVEHASGRGGWRRELVENPRLLVEDVRAVLMGLDLLRIATHDDEITWWFSPTVARWAPAPSADGAAKARRDGG